MFLKAEAIYQIAELQKLVQMMAAAALQSSQHVPVEKEKRVIKPGSIGLYALNPDQEVYINSIFLRPDGLVYRAKLKLNIDNSGEVSWGREILLDLDKVIEIVGETKTGMYNYNTGSVD